MTPGRERWGWADRAEAAVLAALIAAALLSTLAPLGRSALAAALRQLGMLP